MNQFTDKEAEMILLGDIIMKNDIIAECVTYLMPDDFSTTANGMIYAAMVDMYKHNIPIEAITIANQLGTKVQSVGGIVYLATLPDKVSSVLTYGQYLKIIKDKSNKRKLATALQAAQAQILNESDTNEVIEYLQNQFVAARSSKGKELTPISGALEEVFVKVAGRTGYKISGISTGYKTLDNTIGGFNKGDLIILAGRPSMGKTAFTLNIINRIPKNHNIALFSLEMSEEKIATRLLSSQARVGLKRISREKLTDSELNRVSESIGELQSRNNVFIDDSAGMTLAEISAKAKAAKIKYGLDLIVIDHIGKIKPENARATRNDQVGAISNGLKNLAKDLDVSVIALSQLNRGVESRSGNVPSLSDLRDSGNLEQDADVVMLLYREDYYKEPEEIKAPSKLEVIIDKNRDGECGSIYFDYILGTQIIEEKNFK